MKHFKFFIAPFIITLIFCTRCNFNPQKKQHVSNNDSIIKPKYATNFFLSVNKSEKNKIIHIIDPSKKEADTISYRLISEDSPYNTENDITIPIKRLIATSTTDIPFIEALENEKSLIGFTETKYISSKKTRELIDSKKITDIGNLAQLNTELVLDLQPDLFLSYTISGENKNIDLLKRNQIKTFLNTSWLEQHPLGRAEWIKVFGYLFKKEEKANATFKSIEKHYLKLRSKAEKATTKPTILSGNLYKDVWYTPAGNSFEAKLIKDASADYLWKSSEGTGSLALSIETVLDKGQNADIWLGGGMFGTVEGLTNFQEKYKLFKACKTKSVYTKDLTQGKTGGLLYFEIGTLRPDWILEDLIQISHPNLIPKKPFHFYKKLE